MNRRDFFKLAAAAPVALPLAAKAFAAHAQFSGELCTGEYVVGVAGTLSRIKSWAPHSPPNARIIGFEAQQAAIAVIADNEAPLSVDDQMHEHGLFEDDRHGCPFRKGGE